MFKRLFIILKCGLPLFFQFEVVIKFLKISLPKKLKDKYLTAKEAEQKQIDDDNK